MRQSSALIGEMLTREMGKPYQESVSEIGYASTATDYYAEVARHEAGRVFGPIADGQFNFTTKDPFRPGRQPCFHFQLPVSSPLLADGGRHCLRERGHY